MGKIWTTSGFAAMLDRSGDWVRAHSNSGELPHVRNSAGQRVYDERSLEAARHLIKKLDRRGLGRRDAA
jgi:DNA-binding transcriptional MerR regulator